MKRQRVAQALSAFNFVILPLAFLVLGVMGHDAIGLALGVITVGTVSLIGLSIYSSNFRLT